jgi:hypothetical protein
VIFCLLKVDIGLTLKNCGRFDESRWVYKNLMVGIKKVRVLMLSTFVALCG